MDSNCCVEDKSNNMKNDWTDAGQLALKISNMIRESNIIPSKKTEIQQSASYADEIAAIGRDKFTQKMIAIPFVDSAQLAHQNGPDYVMPAKTIRTSDPAEPVTLRAIGDEDTFPNMSMVTMLKDTVKLAPDKPALAVKRNDQWVYWTYTQYWNDICTVAKAFIKLGFMPHHAVGLLGFNAPEWCIASFAAMFAGGISAGIYTTNSAEICKFVLQDSKAQICVVENDLQAQKILKVHENLPHLKVIVQYTGTTADERVLLWSDLMKIGKSVPDNILERRIKGLSLNQCCCLIYTSGTTGTPRGVMLSHDCVSYTSRLTCSFVQLKFGQGRVLSYLPLSHVGAQVGDIYSQASVATTVYFATPDALKGKLVDCLKEVKPTMIFGVPRIYEKIAEKLKEAEAAMAPMKRSLFKWARNQALHHHVTCSSMDEKPSIAFLAAKKLILKKVRKALGLQNCEFMLIGGAPVSVELTNYFTSLDMWLTECYGSSETGSGNVSHYWYPRKIGSSGIALQGVSLKILYPSESGNGEICLYTRAGFMGYLNAEDKTEEALDLEGWVHTGDIGNITKDGYLYITGRIKEIIITAGGENIAPVPIEERVKQKLPVISNCMLIGDKYRFLSMILTLKVEMNLDTLEPTDMLTASAQQWCRSVGSDAETVQDVLQGPDSAVMDAIQKGIGLANEEAISNAQRIQAWRILPVDFSIPGGEFGPTMKVRRPYVTAKYNEVISRIYAI